MKNLRQKHTKGTSKSSSYFFSFGSLVELSSLLILSGAVSTSSKFLNPSSDMSCFAIKFLRNITNSEIYSTTHGNNDLKCYRKEKQKTEKEAKHTSCGPSNILMQSARYYEPDIKVGKSSTSASKNFQNKKTNDLTQNNHYCTKNMP